VPTSQVDAAASCTLAEIVFVPLVWPFVLMPPSPRLKVNAPPRVQPPDAVVNCRPLMLRLMVRVGWFAGTAPLNTPISVVVSFTGAEGGRTRFQFAANSKSVFSVPVQTLDAPDTFDPPSAHIARRKKTAEQLRQRDLRTRPPSQNARADIKWSPVLASSFFVTQLVGALPVRRSAPENTCFYLREIRRALV